MELTMKQGALMALALLGIALGIGAVPLFLQQTGNNLATATSFYDTVSHDINDAVRGKSFPEITATNQRIKLNQSYDPKSWVTCIDTQDGNISNRVEVYGNIDNTTKGDYEIKFSVRNNVGLKTTKKIRVIVD